MITIDEHGDLVVRVIEFDDSIRVAPDQEKRVLREEEFRVKKQTLYQYSKVLGTMLTWHLNSENAHEAFSIKDDSTTCMEVWFRTLHHTHTPTSHKIEAPEIWHLTVAGIKYDIDGKMLKSWFQRWYTWIWTPEGPNVHFLQLLYPCWQYDHAAGFLRATKAAVYHGRGHIMEINPTKHYECHLPSRVIQQVNAAKGRLRTRLHAMTFAPIEKLLVANCDCKEKTLYQYIKALHSTGVWPLDPVWPRMEVTVILDRLNSFKYKPPESACRSFCQGDYEGAVGRAISTVRNYFDGLCLDCMDKSKAKTANYDSDYWHHNDLEEGEWDSGCRVNHGEPTWYFSFMGRKEDRELFFKKKRIPLRAP